jgi:hypothetical protein
MLLEMGKSPHIVSKMLHHESVGITEKFYLKESIEQTLAMADIPWFRDSVDSDIVRKQKAKEIPRFLNEARATVEMKQRMKKKRKHVEEEHVKLGDLLKKCTAQIKK